MKIIQVDDNTDHYCDICEGYFDLAVEFKPEKTRRHICFDCVTKARTKMYKIKHALR